MNKKIWLHIARGFLALITVLWSLSIAGVFAKSLNEPDLFTSRWPYILLSIVITLLPAWGYLRLTAILDGKSENTLAEQSSDTALVPDRDSSASRWKALIGATIAVVGGFALYASYQPKTYEECILQSVKPGIPQNGVSLIKTACQRKFKPPIDSFLKTYSFNTNEALSAGYDYSEIADFLGYKLGFKVQMARQQGSSDVEIVKYLETLPQKPSPQKQ